MKKSVSILAIALAAAFTAPAFAASFDTAAGAKKPQAQQVAAKKKRGGKKA